MRNPGALVLLAALLVTAPAYAGIGGHNGEIGFDFGVTDVDGDLASGSAGRLSLRGGYHFTDLFQIEAQDIGMGASLDSSGGSSGDLVIGAFLLNGVFNFHPGDGRGVPYLLGGLGFATVRQEFNVGGHVSDTGSAMQLAAGSRFFFGKTKRAAVRLEISVMRHKTSDLFIATRNFTERSLTAGFTWRLGAPK